MSQTSTPSEPTTFKVLPIMIALLLSGFIGMFSETALNIALNDLMQILHITTTTAQWLTTAFLLTLGILVPVSGLLLQTFTTRQLFVASLLFSIAGCLVAALAPTFSVLLIARILQAVGTALLLPLMFNTILIIFPAEKRGAAMGIIGLVIMFAPAVGPTIAGLVLQNLSWHWIFWISLPFLVFSLIFGIFFMQNVSKITKPKIDILSILLSSIGFGGVVFGFSKSGEGGEGWASPVVLLPAIIGLIALILFSMRQLKMKQPMLNLRVFKYPMFVIGVVMIFLCMMTILSTMLILPLFLQKGLALSALTAGLVLLPGGIINGLLSPIMGSLFDKFGPKWLVIPGLAIVVAVLFFLSGITTTSAILLIIVLHCCLMIGISMIMMPAQTNGLNQLPLELYPDGTAIMSTLQQVAGAIGTAIAVSILSKGMESYLSQSSMPESVNEMANAMVFGSQHSFFFAMIVSVIGLILAFFIRRVHVKKGAAQAPMH
ncbi:DHA2 family efflux MFS transporter permease subunit [Paenibacillus sp. 1-18]|uniref:DHA2 family efflux MFS transporter permease subunit n=1 Tax=Paenibacillus sp. 1-18 TaxID=1333846 RepID=UPI0018CC4564|nr:DHA2 family efflux MFS transporter permease subunit [Paenibacillus sp. 1-18]